MAKYYFGTYDDAIVGGHNLEEIFKGLQELDHYANIEEIIFYEAEEILVKMEIKPVITKQKTIKEERI